MSSVLQVVIPAALAFLVAYQGSLSRTGRLRRIIRANVDLLDALPADHPNRATLTTHIEKLVDRLVRREERQLEPIVPAVQRDARAARAAGIIAAFVLMGVSVVTMQATGVHPERAAGEWLARQALWDLAVYAGTGIICGGFSLWALRLQVRRRITATRHHR